MFKPIVLASFLLAGQAIPAMAGPGDEAKDKADAAMDAFQWCAAGKIAALGKSESSEFLVEAATEACRKEAEEATDSFFRYAVIKMHASPEQRGLITAMYAKEMHTRVVQLVVAFKTGE